MDSSEGRSGWAADDPRWTDGDAGGKGRLEPSPPPVPQFGAPSPDPFADTVVQPLRPATATRQTAAAPRDGDLSSQATQQFDGPLVLAGPPPDATPTEVLPAIPADPGGPPAPRPGYPMPPAPASRPLTIPGPNGHGARPGSAAPGASPARRPSGRPTGRRPAEGRPDRPGQARGRRRGADEFRRAGRAELFSDDARYSVLFSLTAIWYAPVAIFFLVWVLVGDPRTADLVPRLLSGLIWLTGATVLSLAIVGLLRWASVGWRALTLSIAAALIGGGVVTVAHTLTG